MRLARHQDVDSKIADPPRLGLFWLFLIASGLIVILITFLAMAGLWAAGWIRLGWNLCYVPVAVLLAVTLIPVAFKLHWLWWDILEMLQQTIRAWTERAKYSVRINTGQVVTYELPGPEKTEKRPVIYNSPQGTKLLATEAPALPAATEAAAAEPEPPPQPQARELIILPNNTRVPPETIERVLIQLIEQGRGLGRKAWVPQILDREVYDGLWALFSSCGIIEGRKNKYAGRLGVESMDKARDILRDILG